jgi:hypothetical protein
LGWDWALALDAAEVIFDDVRATFSASARGAVQPACKRRIICRSKNFKEMYIADLQELVSMEFQLADALLAEPG